MDRRDYIIITVITLVFAVMALYRLGSLTVPQSKYAATRENPAIILDFGETVTLEYFVAYFGPQSFSGDFYQRNGDSEEWELIEAGVFSKDVYKWKGFFTSPHQLRYLRLEFNDETCTFHEMLFVDQSGQIIVPINAGAYPGLFDEQGLFDPYLSLTYYHQTIFDEIEYGRTAYELMHGLPTYGTGHPPLGSRIISLGIRLFGMNPFGWRFMSAVFGILTVPLMYAFGKAMFGNRLAAAAVSVLLAFDCLHFTLSRLGTIDSMAAFFILLMYYLFFRYLQMDREGGRSDIPLALCGITMAFAVATKWTGVYAGLGLGLVFLFYIIKYRPPQLKRLLAFCAAFFVAVPVFVYIMSYRQMVLTPPAGGLLQTVAAHTRQIFGYHIVRYDEHRYRSLFYEWPVIWKPLCFNNIPIDSQHTSTVTMMGNPAIWWAGIPCLVFVLYRAVAKRDGRAGFIAVAYLAQYLPWFFKTDITFIYHYYPASLFMILAVGYVLDIVAREGSGGKTIACGYLALAAAVFVIFHPVISGSPVTDLYKDGLRWLPEWKFTL